MSALKAEPEKCKGQCYDSNGGWDRKFQCHRKATIGDYCKTHDPATIKAKFEASHIKWKAKFDQDSAIRWIKQENERVGAWVRENGGTRTDIPCPFMDYLAMAKKEADAHKS